MWSVSVSVPVPAPPPLPVAVLVPPIFCITKIISQFTIFLSSCGVQVPNWNRVVVVVDHHLVYVYLYFVFVFVFVFAVLAAALLVGLWLQREYGMEYDEMVIVMIFDDEMMNNDDEVPPNGFKKVSSSSREITCIGSQGCGCCRFAVCVSHGCGYGCGCGCGCGCEYELEIGNGDRRYIGTPIMYCGGRLIKPARVSIGTN